VSRVRRRRPAPPSAPVAPIELPRGCAIHVPDRGEVFVRDTGGKGPALLLLHGWMASGSLNWMRQFGPLSAAGFRVLAVDHRGHGHGLRSPQPFRLADCAADAAGVVRTLGCGPVTAVGYSMGGPITQLLARDHHDVVDGIVCCATAATWQDPRMNRIWKAMAILRLILGLFPNAAWRRGLLALGFPDSAETSWAVAELSRSNARDVAEAGRELGRYDARGWLGSLGVPSAVVRTTEDRDVPQHRQFELAECLRAPIFDAPGTHMAVAVRADEFNAALLEAVASVRARAAAAPAHDAVA
jgi:pimeloyl-ACP methyl ester carboxylesterase